MSPNLTGYVVHMENAYVPPREIVAADNQEQLQLYIESLQRLLVNFAAYRFRCKLPLNIFSSYTGQTNVFITLRKRHTGKTVQTNLQFHLYIAIKEQLKQAITNLVQPLLTDLNQCPRCYIKHYKQEQMRFLCPKINNPD